MPIIPGKTKALVGQNRKEKRGSHGLESHKHADDGSEIRRSPVEVGSLSHDLQGFSTIPGGCLGFLPATESTEHGVWLF